MVVYSMERTMFRTIPKYDQGQELALKYIWSILQVAATVAHDVFIILYSHLDNTEDGNKSIHKYCKEALRSSVYAELLEDGYSRDYFIVSPREATHFDLKVTRKLLEKIIAEKITKKPMNKVLGIMKTLVYLRNDLCHLKFEALAEEDFKKKTLAMWDNLKKLYVSACELTGTKLPSQTTKELDSILSSLTSTIQTREELESDCRSRGTSQSSEYSEPEYFLSYTYQISNSTDVDEGPSKGAIDTLEDTKTVNLIDKSVQTSTAVEIVQRPTVDSSTQVDIQAVDVGSEIKGHYGTENKGPTCPKRKEISVDRGTQVNLEKEDKKTNRNDDMDNRKSRKKLENHNLENNNKQYKDHYTLRNSAATPDNNNTSTFPPQEFNGLPFYYSAGTFGTHIHQSSVRDAYMRHEHVIFTAQSVSTTSSGISQHYHDSETKERTADSHNCTCTCNGGEAETSENDDAKFIQFVQHLFTFVGIFLVLCIRIAFMFVYISCKIMYDSADSVKKYIQQQRVKNMTRYIWDVNTKTMRFAQIHEHKEFVYIRYIGTGAHHMCHGDAMENVARQASQRQAVQTRVKKRRGRH